MLTKFKVYRLVQEGGEKHLRVNLIWLDPDEVMYFEQTNVVSGSEIALVDCMIALRNHNEAFQVACLLEQSEIDRLTKMLETRR